MSRLQTLAALLLVLCLAFPCRTLGAEGQESEVEKLALANNSFALHALTKIDKQGENLFFSPYSISSLFAVTYAGARGNTRVQMGKVFGFESVSNTLPEVFRKLNAAITATEKGKAYRLIVGNGLWLGKDIVLSSNYVELVKKYYSARLEQVDFAGDPTLVAEKINGWVEKQTDGMIKSLITPGMVNPGAKLVLTNAIYFKGQWKLPFDKGATANEPFTTGSGKKVTVPMMQGAGVFPYLESESLQAIELPYAKGKLAMLVVLPKKHDGLWELEKSLNPETLGQLTSKFTDTAVAVSLPRFSLRSKFMLAERLQEMGMTDAFDSGKADFSGMVGSGKLHIENAVHEAVVDVNETGTKAAAATATADFDSAPEVRVAFTADHPFLFMIRSRPSGCILFVGRLVDPSTSSRGGQ